MNRSIIRRILRLLTIVAVLALASLGWQRAVAALPRVSGSAATAQVVRLEAPTATVAAPAPTQVQVAVQPTATATVAAPPPPQVQVVTQPTATATVAAPPPPPAPAQVEVEGIVIAVDPAAGTITVRDDEGFTSVVSVSAAGTYHVWQEVKVVGTPTGPGGSATSVQAQFIRLEQPEALESALAAPGTTIKVEGRITSVNAAAGTITVQDDDGPATVVALGAAQGPYYMWQKVEVYGTVTSAGSNGATVQAQFIRLKGSDGDDGDNDGGDNDDD
jgi:hypothetical protein